MCEHDGVDAELLEETSGKRRRYKRRQDRLRRRSRTLARKFVEPCVRGFEGLARKETDGQRWLAALGDGAQPVP